jgi:glycosidase
MMMKRINFMMVVLGLAVLFVLVSCGDEIGTEPTSLPVMTVPASTTSPNMEPDDQPDLLYQGTGDMPWWNDAVFYEVFVRSFNDSGGDGVGDINGLIEKLDYLNDGDPNTTDDLGVTGLWLMPIMESLSYHGYDVVDYFKVDEEYGTEEDFRRLIEEAHSRGIRVVVDLVTNHTSSEHPWFQESLDPASEKRDWYIWEDEDPGFRGPEGQQVWHRTPEGYYYALFWDGMPDLNYEIPEVTVAMQDAARYWLEDMGVDGFRLDAIKHIVENGQMQENTQATHDWLKGFYTFYKDINPNALAVGEAWTGTQQVLNYTGDEVDIAFQFDLANAILNSADSGHSPQIGKEQRNVVGSFPPGQYATFLTNHDQNRVMSRLGEDENKAKVAATWLLASPGVPFIYYGEEIGMMGTKPDEDIRRPMQWSSDDGLSVGFTTGRPWRFPAEDYEERSVALQTDDPDSLLNHYRALIHLRNEHEALRIGGWIEVETDSADVYAFLRTFEEDAHLVLINFSEDPVSDYSLSLSQGPLVGEGVPGVLFGSADPASLTANAAGGFDGYKPLETLPPQSSFIFQL